MVAICSKTDILGGGGAEQTENRCEMGEDCDYEEIALDLLESLPGDIEQKVRILRLAVGFAVSVAAQVRPEIFTEAAQAFLS